MSIDNWDDVLLPYPKITLSSRTHVFNEDAIVASKVAALRDIPTTSTLFRELAEEILTLLSSFAMTSLDLKNTKTDVPLHTSILVPMLAEGNNVNHAINHLKSIGYNEIAVLCIVAAPQGVDLIQVHHPDVAMYIASLDDGLNRKGDIVPGLSHS